MATNTDTATNAPAKAKAKGIQVSTLLTPEDKARLDDIRFAQRYDKQGDLVRDIILAYLAANAPK